MILEIRIVIAFTDNVYDSIIPRLEVWGRPGIIIHVNDGCEIRAHYDFMAIVAVEEEHVTGQNFKTDWSKFQNRRSPTCTKYRTNT